MTAEELKAIREQLGMTQVEFAKELGLKVRIISYMETGVRQVSARTEKQANDLLKLRGK